MFEFTTKTIREIALAAPATTRIFEEYKIDYCCGGRLPFGEACAAAGIDPQTLAAKLETVFRAETETPSHEPERMTPSDLIDYIVEKHHTFTRRELDRLAPLMEKVARKHGPHFKELFELQSLFVALADDLTDHLRKEEVILFPFIRTLEDSLAADLAVAAPPFRTVQNPLRVMLAEHDAAGDFLRRMRAITNDYTTPPDVCPSFKALYAGLEDLEKDLHRHIHLENNVLFPQAIELEVKAFSDSEEKAAARLF